MKNKKIVTNYQAVIRRGAGAWSSLKKILEKCVGYSLKNLGPSQYTLRLPWYPNLVRACQLCLLQFNNNADFKNNKTNYRQRVSIRS